MSFYKKQPKLCYLLTINNVKDSGCNRESIERVIYLNGMRKEKISIIYHDDCIGIVLYRTRFDDVYDLKDAIEAFLGVDYYDTKIELV